MATTNTLIDVKNGTLKMTVLGEAVSFLVRDHNVIPSSSLIEDFSDVDTVDALAEIVFLQDFSSENYLNI